MADSALEHLLVTERAKFMAQQEEALAHFDRSQAKARAEMAQADGASDVAEARSTALAAQLAPMRAYAAAADKIKLGYQDGQTISLSRARLISFKDSFFAAMLESGHWHPDATGVYNIDRPYCKAMFDYIRQPERGMPWGTWNRAEQKAIVTEFDFCQIALPSDPLPYQFRNRVAGYLKVDGESCKAMAWVPGTEQVVVLTTKSLKLYSLTGALPVVDLGRNISLLRMGRNDIVNVTVAASGKIFILEKSATGGVQLTLSMLALDGTFLGRWVVHQGPHDMMSPYTALATYGSDTIYVLGGSRVRKYIARPIKPGFFEIVLKMQLEFDACYMAVSPTTGNVYLSNGNSVTIHKVYNDQEQAMATARLPEAERTRAPASSIRLKRFTMPRAPDGRGYVGSGSWRAMLVDPVTDLLWLAMITVPPLVAGAKTSVFVLDSDGKYQYDFKIAARTEPIVWALTDTALALAQPAGTVSPQGSIVLLD